MVKPYVPVKNEPGTYPSTERSSSVLKGLLLVVPCPSLMFISVQKGEGGTCKRHFNVQVSLAQSY